MKLSKKQSKLLTLILALCMLFGVVFSAPAASAYEIDDEQEFESGDIIYCYRVKDDGTALLDYVKAKQEGLTLDELTIPSQINGLTVSEISYLYSMSEVSVKKIIIPDTVMSIGKEAFRYNPATEIIVPQTVTDIEYGEFASCRNLSNIAIPDSVTKIGDYAFIDCVSLTEVNIPNSVTSIGRSAFSRCTGLTSIDIPNSVTSIGHNAFSYCTGLKSIDIPDSVTSIGFGAFYNTAWFNNQPDGLVYAGNVAYVMKGTCPSEVVIKDGIVSITNSAFSGCTSLTSVTIPDSVTSIGHDAFDGCTSLKSVTIPDSVTSIGDIAFYNCKSLTSVTIPDSVTSIGDDAFYNTAWYNNQPDGLVYAGKVAYKMKGDCPSEAVIKDGIVSITDSAFSGCTSLTSVTIPDSVTSIGHDAFDGCTSLKSVTIPDSVTSIGDHAFFNCKSLTSVTIPSSITSIGSDTFGYYYDDNWETEKVDGFTIYGYEGSEAERYAKENEFTFVPLKSKADEATGIIVDLPEDIDLTVKDITAEIISAIPDEGSKMTAYDISLTKYGKTIQPENIVTVKIPCSNENAKVYRIDDNGTKTDMNAEYADGYMVFTADHFSVYVLAEPEPEVVTVKGDVTGDGKTNVQDCTAILRYVRKLDTLSDDQLKLGDVTGDGKVNVQDVTRILRHVRKIETLY